MLLRHRFLIFLIITLALIGCGAFLVFGQTAPASSTPPTLDDLSASPAIQALDTQINQKKDSLNALSAKQALYQQAINGLTKQEASLANQVTMIDDQLSGIQLSLDKLQLQIGQNNLEIQKTNLEIQTKQEQIDKTKEQLSLSIELLSQEDNKSQLEILLTNNNLADFVDQVKYLKDINGGLIDSVNQLQTLQDQLAQKNQALHTQQTQMIALQQQLDAEQATYNDTRDSKTVLLAQTKSSETKYESLLNEARAEQTAAENNIFSLEKTYQGKVGTAANGATTLSWPVPKNTITAYFHDPNYPFRYLFEHPAIDIRAAQATPVHAAAAGYVAAAHDGGMGYSYIMLIHGNGLATVYGHVSKIMVKADEYVTAGQVIGLSGATPGTPGAGPFTTGPHLHFEVRLNGIPVDPLGYLPQ